MKLRYDLNVGALLQEKVIIVQLKIFVWSYTGLKEVCVSTADEAYKILTIGKQNLNMACTKLNHNSSRRYTTVLF